MNDPVFHRLCYCYCVAVAAAATVIVVISIHPFNLFSDSFIHSFRFHTAHCIIFSFKVNLLQKCIYTCTIALIQTHTRTRWYMENLCHRIVHIDNITINMFLNRIKCKMGLYFYVEDQCCPLKILYFTEESIRESTDRW